MSQNKDPNDRNDPKGLIRESFRIDGIGTPECRSIFLDWALSLPVEADTDHTRQVLLAQYRPDHPDHPMIAVLDEGLGDGRGGSGSPGARPRRRGGWRSRPRDAASGKAE
ncbi:MAG: hypothetical protein AAGF79_13560 [Pseudomonadota bacterium]